MAVPGRRNGMNDDEEDLDDNALFEEEGLVEDYTDTPPHLRDLSAAAQVGDVHALRLALGYLSVTLSPLIFLFLYNSVIICHTCHCCNLSVASSNFKPNPSKLENEFLYLMFQN